MKKNAISLSTKKFGQIHVAALIVLVGVLLVNVSSVQAETFGNHFASFSGTTSRNVCYRHTAPANGTITHVTSYGFNAAGGNLRHAVYSTSGANPGTLLTQSTSATTLPTSAAWATTTVTAYVMTAGVDYWICAWADVTLTYYYLGGTSNYAAFSNSFSFPNWENPYSVSSLSNRNTTMYATYTPTLPGTKSILRFVKGVIRFTNGKIFLQ